MTAGLDGVAGSAAEAMACAGLGVLVTDPAGEVKRCREGEARSFELGNGEECFAEAVECVSFTGRVAGLAEQAQGLLLVADGLLI